MPGLTAMPDSSASLPAIDDIARTLAPSGLVLRGAFHPAPEDGVPAMADGRAAATVVLVGNVGSSIWPVFSDQGLASDAENPLDRWAEKVLTEAAAGFGAEARFPFGGPPYLPFQRWAMRADEVFPSPIGPLIHPDYGLWHAYRGALLFAARLALPPRTRRDHPCETCADKP